MTNYIVFKIFPNFYSIIRFKEIGDFNYSTHATASKSKETRHFKQIIWKADQKAGFGIARHAESKTLVVIGRYASAPMAGQ